MKHKFYDVKIKEAVEAEVLECVTYGSDTRTRYAFKGKTGVSHRVPWKQGLLACAKWFF